MGTDLDAPALSAPWLAAASAALVVAAAGFPIGDRYVTRSGAAASGVSVPISIARRANATAPSPVVPWRWFFIDYSIYLLAKIRSDLMFAHGHLLPLPPRAGRDIVASQGGVGSAQHMAGSPAGRAPQLAR